MSQSPSNTRKSARHEHGGLPKRAPHLLGASSNQGPPMTYYGASQNQFQFEQPHTEPSYMLPYAPYQQPQGHYPPQIMYHNAPPLPMYGMHVGPHNIPYQQHTPSSKRPRTDLRNISISSNSSQRRSTNGVSRATPTRSPSAKKTFSDFRIASIQVGSWSSNEVKSDQDTRDSRIRFCFKNQNDRDVDSTLSATEAALISPDRLSISLRKGTHRIVIPAHHIKSVEFRRRAGKITVMTDGWAAFETSDMVDENENDLGSPDRDHDGIRPVSWRLTEEDITQGQLAKAKKLEIWLDLHKPLTEPKWARGNITEHIDSNSRFLRIMNIVDAIAQPSFDQFLDLWARDDSEKAYFYEYHLNSDLLLKVLTDLMSPNNILTPAIISLLHSFAILVKNTSIQEHELKDMMKSALIQVPDHMLTRSMDQLFAIYLANEGNDPQNLAGTPIESSYGGSKRQRGESEVPSDQLAKTTLDEKRRRLSDSEPQNPQIRGKSAPRSQSTMRNRVKSSEVTQNNTPAPMLTSRSQDSALPVHPSDVKSHTRTQSDGSTPSDGARMSREELLRELEEQEGHDSSSDHDEIPVIAGSLAEQTLRDDWPPLQSEVI